jgi:hypothetical protein
VIERGYEGFVAKDEASVYEGGATRRWLNRPTWVSRPVLTVVPYLATIWPLILS